MRLLWAVMARPAENNTDPAGRPADRSDGVRDPARNPAPDHLDSSPVAGASCPCFRRGMGVPAHALKPSAGSAPLTGLGHPDRREQATPEAWASCPCHAQASETLADVNVLATGLRKTGSCDRAADRIAPGADPPRPRR